MTAASSPVPALVPGVSLELARWRSAHYRDIEYELDIALTSGGASLEGRLTVGVTLAAPVDVVLDWRTDAEAGANRGIGGLTVNGRPPDGMRFEAGHLVIPRSATRRGRNRIALRFRAPVSVSGTAVTRFVDAADGREYLHTLFVPADASTVFPCFDQPDLKARFSLRLTTPEGWHAVSNAPLEGVRREVGLAEHRFERTEPISTYQFAFAAGPFAEVSAPAAASSRQLPTMRLFVRQSKLDAALREGPELLELARNALAWFSAYFDRSFPFAKYDLVLVPELAYGGMEHAGATFLHEESVLFPFEPSANDRLRRALLLLHETSHQWFGDLVTMRWFDDLWLKEGFANFMSAKAAEALLGEALPSIHPWIAFGALKTAAYRTDATQGTTPIWREIENLSVAKSAYGSIVYSKAPAVLRQAEHYVGETAFRSAVRDLLARHAYGAAQWSDLVAALERAAGRPLADWAEAWVKRRGMPRVRAVPVRDAAGRIEAIELSQESVLGDGHWWPMRLQLGALAVEGMRLFDVHLRGPRTRAATPGLDGALLIHPNHGDYGYGQFLLDPDSRDFVLAHPERIGEPLLRSLAFDSVWESVREAELDPVRYIELALAWLPHENDDMIAATLLARMSTAYLRFLPPERRRALAARVEAFTAAQMKGAATASRRIAYWRAFLGVARTEAARATLKALFSGRETIPGVPLRSQDRFRIAEALLALGDAEAEALLAAQSAADPGSDGRRHAFAAAAARPDADHKRALFRRFLDDPELQESWIEEALGPLNDPDHAALTLPLLREALEALPRLRRERKIFFVNGWLANFIGGQSSAEALGIVRDHLATAGLEEDLRLKVLEAVDPLERIVRIRAKYGSAGEAR